MNVQICLCLVAVYNDGSKVFIHCFVVDDVYILMLLIYHFDVVDLPFSCFVPLALFPVDARVEVINPQRACARVTVITFSVCLSCHKLILNMASFYLSKWASKHGRRLFKCSTFNPNSEIYRVKLRP